VGGPDMAPHTPQSFGAPRRSCGALSGTHFLLGAPKWPANLHGGLDMAPKPPALVTPRGTRGAPRFCVPPQATARQPPPRGMKCSSFLSTPPSVRRAPGKPGRSSILRLVHEI